jgi:hypothetical protein
MTTKPAAQQLQSRTVEDINSLQRLLMGRGERTENVVYVSVLCAYGLRAEVGVFGSEVRYSDHT